MPDGPRLSRRSALAAGLVGGLAGAVAVGGCEGSESGATPTPTPTPSVDPDAALVEDVLARLARAERTATAGGRLEVAAMHRAHIEALDGEPPAARSQRAVGDDAVRRREQQLQRDLVAAAMAAESGALAGLLASMSAAVSQRLATWEVAP